jgi:hypothetical protein
MASEEQGRKIRADLMKQFINIGRKASEMGFMHLDTGEPQITGEFPDLPDGFTVQVLPDEPKTVPLSIYIDDEKYIVGKATVIGRKVHAQIEPKDGRNLERLVQEGIINGVSVTFTTEGPAHPELPFDQVTVGQSEEIKYSFEPGKPFPPATHKWTTFEGMKFQGPGFDAGILDEPFSEKIMSEFWKRDQLPQIEGLTADHTLEDEEPWQDKYPYGKAPE